ncbi:MAG: serine hydrolase domain-containing protein [Acidobacteriota bacterium]
MNRKVSSFFLAFCFLSSLLLAQKLPRTDAEKVGMSSDRLARIETVMQQYIDQGKLAGIVAMVVRNGEVAYAKALGKLDVEKGTPMPEDAIFRIASQSKALTSVATMILVEEGRLLLSDPVSKFIPEFKNSRVAIKSAEKGAEGYLTVPAKRPITIRDLLTHTAGISYGDGPAADQYVKAELQGWNFTAKREPIGESIKKLAALPFDTQPGEKFVYGYNVDILGYVVERIAGMTLADFIRTRITEPLKMVDTHFYLPKEKVNRFTPVYGLKNGRIELVEPADNNLYVNGPRMSYSGGAGLLATAEDYARFLQMLLNGGELEGARILSPKTVRLMTVNHVGTLFSDRLGFGLGFWVIEDLGRAGEPGSAGAFGWGGAYHTSYWVDPAERLVAVFMTQLLPAGDLDDHGKFRALVYQAITTSYQRGS